MVRCPLTEALCQTRVLPSSPTHLQTILVENTAPSTHPMKSTPCSTNTPHQVNTLQHKNTTHSVTTTTTTEWITCKREWITCQTEWITSSQTSPLVPFLTQIFNPFKMAKGRLRAHHNHHTTTTVPQHHSHTFLHLSNPSLFEQCCVFT